MKCFISFLLLYCSIGIHAQVSTFFVHPSLTDTNYDSSDDDHFVVKNLSNSKDQLFIWIGGTGAETSVYRGICTFAGEEGFDVVNIAYPNNIPAPFFANSRDETSFERYRQEVTYGTPVSIVIDVDTLNSIHTRVINLLSYLEVTYPSQNWGQYLDSQSGLVWSKIVIAGHSQGAGHAAYFGKINPLNRVLMFSGPNDYSDFFQAPAIWLSEPGLTSSDQYYSYLSLLDEVIPFQNQFENIGGLGTYPQYDTINVATANAPFENTRNLYTDVESRPFLNHSAPIFSNPKNEEVWAYMLSNNESTSTTDLSNKQQISIFPNPTVGETYIQMTSTSTDEPFGLYNSNGRLLYEARISNTNSMVIDMSGFDSGYYLITVGEQAYKLIKN